MDERFFLPKIGQPIPDWDWRHRLPTSSAVGPECYEFPTTYRINSTFMDVSDQPNMIRQWGAFAGAAIVFGMLGMIYDGSLPFLDPHPIPMARLLSWLVVPVAGFLSLSWALFRTQRDEYFALTRRPIRFNRKTRTIYAIRRRRFFAPRGMGDITWEAPWNSDAIFCIHKGVTMDGPTYHIRRYTLDENGNVLRAFAIGREWIGNRSLAALLAQWNYWCLYMNRGPQDLPPPSLYLSENEDLRESFLYCLYGFGFGFGPAARIVLMPFILPMTFFRALMIWTCREPVWPRHVELACQVEPNDPYDMPNADTPVGWAQTILSTPNEIQTGVKHPMPDWEGDTNADIVASMWAADDPPDLATLIAVSTTKNRFPQGSDAPISAAHSISNWEQR